MERIYEYDNARITRGGNPPQCRALRRRKFENLEAKAFPITGLDKYITLLDEGVEKAIIRDVNT